MKAGVDPTRWNHTRLDIFRVKLKIPPNILKIYTTLGYIVSLILLNLGHVFRFRIVSPSSRGLVKQYNQELCISSNARCFTKRLQSKSLNLPPNSQQIVQLSNTAVSQTLENEPLKNIGMQTKQNSQTVPT